MAESAGHLEGLPADFAALTDCALIGPSGVRFPVHKAILARASRLAASLLSAVGDGEVGSTSGAELGRALSRPLDGFSAADITAFLRLLYALPSRKMLAEAIHGVQHDDAAEEVIFSFNLEPILQLAKAYDCPDVFSVVEEALLEEPVLKLAMLMSPLRWLLLFDEYYHMGYFQQARNAAISHLSAKFTALQTDPLLPMLSPATMTDLVRMLGYRMDTLAQSCSHVKAVEDRSMQRFSALAQEVAAPYCPDPSRASQYVTHWAISTSSSSIKLGWALEGLPSQPQHQQQEQQAALMPLPPPPQLPEAPDAQMAELLQPDAQQAAAEQPPAAALAAAVAAAAPQPFAAAAAAVAAAATVLEQQQPAAVQPMVLYPPFLQMQQQALPIPAPPPMLQPQLMGPALGPAEQAQALAGSLQAVQQAQAVIAQQQAAMQAMLAHMEVLQEERGHPANANPLAAPSQHNLQHPPLLPAQQQQQQQQLLLGQLQQLQQVLAAEAAMGAASSGSEEDLQSESEGDVGEEEGDEYEDDGAEAASDGFTGPAGSILAGGAERDGAAESQQAGFAHGGGPAGLEQWGPPAAAAAPAPGAAMLLEPQPTLPPAAAAALPLPQHVLQQQQARAERQLAHVLSHMQHLLPAAARGPAEERPAHGPVRHCQPGARFSPY